MVDIRRIGEDGVPEVTFGALFDDDDVQQYYVRCGFYERGLVEVDRRVLQWNSSLLLTRHCHSTILYTHVSSAGGSGWNAQIRKEARLDRVQRHTVAKGCE